jgi:hypothetical protein
LKEMRQTHLRLLSERDRAFGAVSELRRRFEREDEERKEALTAALLVDGKPRKVATTPEAERQAQLGEAMERGEAAIAALGEFLVEALAALDAKREEWSGDLDEHRRRADEKRGEALRVAAEAEAEAREFDRLRDWLSRTSGGDSGFHMAWGLLPTSPPEESIELSPALAGTDLTGYVRVGEEIQVVG